MKNFKTKLLALMLVFATAFGSVPQTVQAAVSTPTELVYYLSGKNYTMSSSFNINGLSKSSKITKLKSSKKSVITLNSYTISGNTSTGTTKFLSSNEKDSSWSDKSYNAYVQFTANKAGTSNITYKIGKKSYTTKITVKEYTNPLKTVEISGLKDGKKTNLKGLVDDESYASALTLKSTQKDAKIKLATKKGWKISYATLNDNSTINGYEVYNWAKGLSSVTLRPGTLKKGVIYTLSISLYNEKNGGYLYITYNIN